MELNGQGYATGAGTIINAIATWKGAAFGIDLKTYAQVDLSQKYPGIKGIIENNPGADTRLIERAVELVLEHFNMKFGGTVSTTTQIPLASGLKSSSAAANASVIATLDAIGETMDPLDAVKIGVQAARDVGVTVTGAFDDACASLLGGVVITDNSSMELIKRENVEMEVLILSPDRKAYSSQTDVIRSKLMAPWIDIAYGLALEGKYENAMTLNGFLYCSALGFDSEPLMKGLEAGINGVSLSGTGPSYVALVDHDKVSTLQKYWNELNISGNMIKTKINNEPSMKSR
ncbi:shikimate kinase [Methanosalsum zhilinae DSM 4017]|uniref:Shikimate kinase n=1 Tax=Methanosalsum zhilinae (strain DSM 4017 / NBRC 107636 / OCM 62 / WeN5) TaxID=679901 RepID=F7XN07_METZD|nr:shikimate kinase [Methanosalsum zhilinae]AEH61116.1 shikimate kinase [Methanosalsum zhilinae DSM 4017]